MAVTDFILPVKDVVVTEKPKPHELHQLIVTRGSSSGADLYSASASFGVEDSAGNYIPSEFKTFFISDSDLVKNVRVLLFAAQIPSGVAALAPVISAVEQKIGISPAGMSIRELGVHLFTKTSKRTR